MSLLALMIGSGMYASLKKVAPPGPVKYLFMAVYTLEDRLNESPEGKKARVDKRREQVKSVIDVSVHVIHMNELLFPTCFAQMLAARDPRFDVLRKLPKNKEEAVI